MNKPLLCASALVAVGTIFSLYPSADALMKELPLPGQLRECYQRAQNYTMQNYVGGLYSWYCETPIRAQIKGSPTPLKPVQYEYFRGLYNTVESKHGGFGRKKRQAPFSGQRCLRKEYRMMADQERTRFHAAVNALKQDRTVEPNKYDALALFHTGIATFVAHGGPGFPGWHRLYLLLLEAALQEVDPTVCIPYWDSSLDSALPNPADSYIWSDDFFGNGEGQVVRGPFANWVTPDGIALRRSVGTDGILFTRANIESIMSRNTYEEILLADQDPQYNLEFHHGGAHVFVGGDMERLDTAAYDVVFFLHHAFVDYIWELFRNKMRANGLNPEVYPTSPTVTEFHLGTAAMGFGNITHAEGFLNTLTETYQYQPSPECSRLNPDCGSKYLWCDVAESRCIPINPLNPPAPTPTPGGGVITSGGGGIITSGGGVIQPVPNPNPQPNPTGSCPHSKPQAYQNSFCINGYCDVSQWVWVPVKIVAQRPPEFTNYMSYPVQDSKIINTNDIYEPSAYSDTSRYINTNKPKPKAYEHCETLDGVGKIFVTSVGVNYDGTYKESAIIDQRLATSIGVTYIAVKDPGVSGKTEVILRAHDQCGRICHTSCKVPGSNPAKYAGCSGVVDIDAQHPKMYGQTYAAATLMTYDYASDPMCPSFNTDDFFVTFYCDYLDHLPWVEKPVKTFPGPSPVVPLATVNHNHGNPGECRISSECVIDTACYVDPTGQGRQCGKYMEMHECLGNCGRYAVCNYGSWWPRYCPTGMKFDERVGQCVRGNCLNTPTAIKPTQTTFGGGSFVPFPTSAQTRSPVPLVPTSYYGRLIGRFNLGK